MASSTASRRLFLEYKNLTSNPPDGITAGPVSEDDIFLWEALIQGPDGTPFEGGIFPAELKFPKDYPLNPPSMRFLGEVWHPNGKLSPLPRFPNPTTITITSLIQVMYLTIRKITYYAHSLTLTHSLTQSTPTASSASPSSTLQATIRTTTKKPASAGVRFRASRKS